MKFTVVLAVALACAMAAPQSNTAGKSINNFSDGIVKRSPTSTLENQQFGQNPVIRKRRINLDANGKLVDFDDDDLQIVTTGLSGRQVAFQPKQNPTPVVNRVPVRSSSVGSVSSSGQSTSDIIFVSDDSRETDDFDDDFGDLDDFAIVSPNRLNSIPFVNRQNAARLVSQPSIFNPSTSSSRVPVRSSNFGTVTSSGQANSDFIFINDDSRETEDHDDLDDDDFAIISPNRLSSFPFVNRQNSAFVPQSSVFNPSPSFVRAPLRQTRMKPRFVQSTSTCTCPPQTVTRFPQAVSATRGFLPFMRFPTFPSFPIQYFLDD